MTSALTNNLWKSKSFVLVWQIVLGLFCIATLTSKSGMEFFGTLMLGMSLAGIHWKNFFSQEKMAVGFFLLYPLAILCNLFSLGRGASALHVALAWPWPLIVLPTLLVMSRPKDIRLVKYCLSISLAIACLYCIYKFGSEYDWDFNGIVRVPSFWDISRWGLFCAFSLILLMAILTAQSTKKLFSSKTGLALLTLAWLDLICLFLSNDRGPWLAFGISTIVFFILYPKIWKWILPIALLMVAALAFSKGLSSRFSSIVAVQTKNGDLTSKNNSNRGRLSMWKVASDFYDEQPLFGTGFENSAKPLTDFLNKQTDEYRQKYTLVEFSYQDQHSCFLSILVQMGVIFSFGFWILVAVGFVSVFRRWYQTRSLLNATLLSAIIFHLVLSCFYSSFLSFELMSFIPLFIMRESNNGTT